MVPDGLNVGLPAARGVAGLARSPQLAHVDVGMAVCAAAAGFLEIETRMTIAACDTLMQAAEREPRLVMLEIRRRAEGPPACRRVAIFTGNLQSAVRASGGSAHHRLGCASQRIAANPERGK